MIKRSADRDQCLDSGDVCFGDSVMVAASASDLLIKSTSGRPYIIDIYQVYQFWQNPVDCQDAC